MNPASNLPEMSPEVAAPFAYLQVGDLLARALPKHYSAHFYARSESNAPYTQLVLCSRHLGTCSTKEFQEKHYGGLEAYAQSLAEGTPCKVVTNPMGPALVAQAKTAKEEQTALLGAIEAYVRKAGPEKGIEAQEIDSVFEAAKAAIERGMPTVEEGHAVNLVRARGFMETHRRRQQKIGSASLA